MVCVVGVGGCCAKPLLCNPRSSFVLDDAWPVGVHCGRKPILLLLFHV